jgi:hypothetical protein
MISEGWRPFSWMQFPNFFFKNRPWHGPTTDDRSVNFPDEWLPSYHSTYGVCECKHAISNIPEGENLTWKDRKSEGAKTRLRNGKWGARRTQIRGAQQTKSPLLLKWPTQRKRKPTTSSSPPPTRPTYWVLPIQEMSGSSGSSCIPRSSKWPLSIRFPHQNSVLISPLRYTRHMPSSSQVLDLNTRINNSLAPHNDVSVNDGPHIRRWSHKIII